MFAYQIVAAVSDRRRRPEIDATIHRARMVYALVCQDFFEGLLCPCYNLFLRTCRIYC